MKYFILSLFLLLTYTSAYSQNWKKVDSVFAPSGIKVQTFSCPFFADIDNDGDHDLFLGTLDNQAEYFENISGTGLPKFKADTSVMYSIYANGLQFTNADYPALHDLDNDGDMDMIIGGYNGFLYYKNTGNASTPSWEKIDTMFINLKAEIGNDAKPVFVDIDNDGDLDLFAGLGDSFSEGLASGVTIGYRNIGDASHPVFARENSFTLSLGDVGYNAYPSFADLDGDNDYDLLMGRDGGVFYYFKNTGTPQAPVWTRDYTVFQNVETTTYWKDPMFADFDKDGDSDLIYGTADGTLFYYENTGSSTSPAFQYKPEYFRIIKSGGTGNAALADVDKDGDFDLLSGQSTGGFKFFNNEGSASTPQFRAASTFQSINPGSFNYPVFVDIDNDGDIDLASGAAGGKLHLYINNNGSFTANTSIFSFVSISWVAYPAFVDIDDDGDQDLLLGQEDAVNFKFYVNDGNNVFTQNSSLMSGIQFANDHKPVFADTDNDGDYDLFLGTWNGFINYYENTGTKTAPQWSRNDSYTSGVRVKRFAAPGFADLDNDGRLDMIVCEQDGNFSFYKNISAVLPVELTSFTAEVSGQIVTLKWVTASEINNRGFELEKKVKDDWIVFGFVEGKGTTTSISSYSYSFKADQTASYRLKQVDFDGTFIYSNVVEVSNLSLGKYFLMQNYPNPFNPSTQLSFGIKEAGNVSLKIYDVLGNEIITLVNEHFEPGEYMKEFNSSGYNLPSGAYYYRLEAGSFKETKKMLLMK